MSVKPTPPPETAESPSHSLILSIEGMSCASCAVRIQEKLNTGPGVRDAAVNFASHKAYVQTGPDFKDITTLQLAVEEAGYSAKPYLPQYRPSHLYQAEQDQWGWRMVFGGLLVLPFLLEHLLNSLRHFHLPLHVQVIFSALVYFLVGWPFHVITLKGLRHGRVTMDTLVSLGSSVAFFASLPVLFGFQGEVYF